MRKFAIFFIFLYAFMQLSAQLTVKKMEVYFHQGSSTWSPRYMENQARLDTLIAHIKQIQNDSASYTIQRIVYEVSCSPEGSVAVNQRLAERRMKTLTKILHKDLDFSDDANAYNVVSENWSELLRMVEADAQVPYRDEVMTLLREAVQKIGKNMEEADEYEQKLIRLHNSLPWQYLHKHAFSRLRHFKVHIYIGTRTPEELIMAEELQLVEEDAVLFEIPFATIPDIMKPTMEQYLSVEPTCTNRCIYAKINALSWLLMMSNVAVEWQFAKRWSATLPVYYSAMNYFKSTLKFRTLCLQPELRYWFPMSAERGIYAGAHLGVAWFNYAKNGDYRYQDHGRNKPILGGGISTGYRMPLGRNHHWHMEFTLGAGVYRLHYDVFHNEPNGKLIETRRQTFFGIDNAAVTVAYKFNLN